jgi:hypothetical protein
LIEVGSGIHCGIHHFKQRSNYITRDAARLRDIA